MSEQMTGRQSAPDPATASASDSRAALRYWLAAVAVALLGAAFMSYRLGDAIRGYHGFNEGFYLANALKDSARPLLAPILQPLDPNNSFVYPAVLSLAVRAFGFSVAWARAVSVVSTAATVVLTFAVGKRLYNERIGLLASVLVTFAPGMMLVGRNAQIDPLLVALIMASSLAYLRAVSEETNASAAVAGLLIALAVLTKLPAVILVAVFAAWQTWRSHGLAWLRLRSTWVTALVFSAIVLPWYLLRFVSSSAFVAVAGLPRRDGQTAATAGLLEVRGCRARVDAFDPACVRLCSPASSTWGSGVAPPTSSC